MRVQRAGEARAPRQPWKKEAGSGGGGETSRPSRSPPHGAPLPPSGEKPPCDRDARTRPRNQTRGRPWFSPTAVH